MQEDDFPTICERCYGDKEHIKMMRQEGGEQCKLCTRPFTVFRWKSSRNAGRIKKTIICSTCATIRNCCQSCMLDMIYGIPIDIRDTALKMAGLDEVVGLSAGPSTTNSEVKAIFADKQERNGKISEARARVPHLKSEADELLSKLAQKLDTSVSQRDDSLATKVNTHSKASNVVNISKYLKKFPLSGPISLPKDNLAISSFFIFGFDPSMPQYCLTDYCKSFGPIKSTTVIHNARCGFVSFLRRKDAESFAQSIIDKNPDCKVDMPGVLILEDKYVMRVSWGKVISLNLSTEEQRKLGLVILKVMKQLAEKESTNTKGKIKEPYNSVDKQKKSKEKFSDSKSSESPKYKVLDPNFEI